MIALVIAIAVFRFYQKLGVRHQKVHWQIGLLGMIVFLIVQYISVYSFEFFKALETDESTVSSVLLFGFVGSAISIVVVFLLYQILDKRWNKKGKSKIESEINDIGFKE